jgi:uncharacterized membrane protein
MIEIAHVWYALGAFLAGVAVLQLRDRQWRSGAFWAIVAVPFVAGDLIARAAKAGEHWPAQLMGAGVIALGVLATRKRVADASEPPGEQVPLGCPAPAKTLGNRVFVPALMIPAVTLALVYLAKVVPIIDPAQATLIALALAATIALATALAITRSHPLHALTEGRRLLDSIGWAAVLPMMLATLGTVFAKTGVGDAIADAVGAVIPTDSRIACILAFAIGMVLFTVIMGNAFAAFPVMMAGIGLPLLIHRHHADPAALGAIGMVTGYCGTLVTPMAANFNLVPAALLELRDDYGVIRAQWPTAAMLFAVNVAIMTIVV